MAKKRGDAYNTCRKCTHSENVHILGENKQCYAYRCDCEKFVE